MALTDWFLAPGERGNPGTRIDARRGDGRAWSDGNLVRPLIHGGTYFAELFRAVTEMRAGDLLLFTDWRGDPDESLTGEPATEISRVLCEAAERGVNVRGLVWRSHLDRLAFSASENRHLGEEIEAAGGQCLLDMRVRTGGSHHQKFVVLRHPGRPGADVAFVGGIDLAHSRRDDAGHGGDPQRQPMAAVYGPTPPWHDVQIAVSGPAVGDVEASFRERWDDPQPLSRNPAHRIADRLRRIDRRARPLPPQLPDPPPAGGASVQILRSYPRRLGGYAFAPQGERSIARSYRKAFAKAERLIYLEDQYLWSRPVAEVFAEALTASPQLRLIAVLPPHPDEDGRISYPPNVIGRQAALALIRAAGGARVAFYGPENPQGTPVYVHAKVCVVDDTWAAVGSDNFNRRSWSHDSELSAAVLGGGFAGELRLALAAEHLGRSPGDVDDLRDPRAAFEAFTVAARDLEAWHAAGRTGERPPGRLRPLPEPPVGALTRLWATPLYRGIYDPDGRPRRLRRRHIY
ncbi:MAG TPA: phospholipase D-like domain-containing protein [Mycobacteriales bacterium]|nr:phospholipase D-like domain-containing protein [Mycobacteriales bacterium]